MREPDQASQPHQLPPDTLLQGRYRLVRVLGEGGFGITYEGWDETLLMRVAVKEYFPKALVTRHQKASKDIAVPDGEAATLFARGKAVFLNEARTLAQFQQDPGIVSVTNFFEENRTAYIVMEYLEGRDLKNLLEEKGTLPYREAYTLLKPIMHSLVRLHESGLIHRDISPSNIRVLPDGSAKLLDFGASRAIDSEADASRSIYLKPGYSPEEQYRSRGEQGPWTDVYALCATLYHMIVGFPPDDSLQRILLDEVKKPSELGVAIPAKVQDALMCGLAVQSRDRFQTVQELEAALDPNTANERQTDNGQPKKEALPWLNLIPVAGLLGLFEMHRRTGQKRFSRIGLLFLSMFSALFLLLLAALALYAAAECAYYQASKIAFLTEFRRSGFETSLRLIGILSILLYLTRAIYTFVVRRDYARYRRAYLAKHPQTVPSAAERAAGRGLLGWRIVGFLPYIFGYGGLHIGTKAKCRSLSLLGGAALLCTFLVPVSALMHFEAAYLPYREEQVVQSVLNSVSIALGIASLLLYMLHLIRLHFLYPAYFAQESKIRAQVLSAYPNLSNKTWRAENSRWQIWTFIPLLGGIGLILAGRRGKRRDLVVKGTVLLLLNLLTAILFLLLYGKYTDMIEYGKRAWLQVCIVPILLLPLFLWRHGIYLGFSNRFDVLAAIAEDLGPYFSRADKEIAEMK